MYLTSVGMVCSVGLTAPTACAAMRAGIARFDELIYCDNEGEAIIGATVPGVAPHLGGSQRLFELLVPAIADCIGDGLAVSPNDMPLIVGLAEPSRPGGTALTAGDIGRELQSRLGVRFHPTLSRTVAKGHTSGIEALRTARDLLRQSGVAACLVCGVDSYINVRSLSWLDRHLRLKTVRNSDGVIPGEAAAAVIVQRQAPPGRDSLVQVSGLGFGHEAANILSEEPLLGLGLTQAARAALAEAGLQMHEIGFRLSDLAGESYAFQEQALALMRLLKVHLEELPLWHCAESVGDTGAAAGICQCVAASQAFLKRYAPGDQTMCYASAVSGDRAVAVLRRIATPRVSAGPH